MRVLFGLLAFALPILAAVPAGAAASIDAQFQAWLSSDLWPDAKKEGISEQTFAGAFAGVHPNLKLPDLVLPGEKPSVPKTQAQAEFNAPSDYFAEKKLGLVVAGGRGQATANAATLKAVEKKFGVPGDIVLAIWGRETGYGAAKIPYDAFEVLGTKAFLSTRKEMFRTELIAALKIVQEGKIARKDMRSSWAGALGQPQFLPTSFLKHAVDFDGDGRTDIWNSVPDTLASIASYLKDYDWQPGRGWGYEVTVPANVSCALEGPDRGRKISAWAKLGIARVNGKPFPSAELGRQGFLLMPAGRNGPAFVVTPNFYVLKQYNVSDLYALFIGHGADRIGGAQKPFSGTWTPVDGLFRSDIADLQKALQAKGYDIGNADGLPGFKTRRSIGDWQEKNGMAPTCYPSKALVEAFH